MAKRKNRRILIPILIIFFSLILISAILMLIYTFSGNYINIGYEDLVKDSKGDAKDSNLIIANNVLLGASKDTKWITANDFYNSNKEKIEFEVDMFSKTQKYGTYKTASLKKHKNGVVYTTIAKESVPEEYLALTATDNLYIIPGMSKLSQSKEDISYVKQAIGSYKLMNGSVKILESYSVNIKTATDKIIVATSEKPNLLGVYSVVVYVTNNTPYLVKYAYVRDLDNSNRWPVYSLSFVMDLNENGIPEIILQETTGDDVSYSVLELRDNNKFYTVLKTILPI